MRKITTLFYLLVLSSISPAIFSQIVINEIVTSNTTVNNDEDGSYEDWIELYNTASETVSLEGYGITDNPAFPFKWAFPNYSMEAGAHLLVWCSDKNRSDPALPLHTNFKISAAGEAIRLTLPSGTVADEVPPTVIPQNTSYGRSVSGGPDFIVFSVPTPGAPNSGGGSEILSEPVFSVNSGFFDSPFTLSITHPDPEVTILYTLDGSEPKLENLGGKTYHYKNQYAEFPEQTSGELLSANYTTLSYTAPISVYDRSEDPNKIAQISSTFNYFPYYLQTQPISKSTVVRANAYKTGSQPSQTATRNYFVGVEDTPLPIISLNLDEDLFFDYDYGIHVAGKDFDDWRAANNDASSFFSNNNYMRSGDATEARANLSFFKEGQQQLNQDVGIRINGGSTRHYPNKSLRIYARPEYGNDNLNYPFFNDLGDSAFKTIILRNSGNDIQQTYFRDAFIQRASAHLNVSIQNYQPAVVYLNSEYWGLLNIRERYDKHYFSRVYGVENDMLDFLEATGAQVQEGNADHYFSMLDFMENNDLSVEANYDYIKTLMDTENFTDYLIANIYARNTDWPHNNIEFWRKKTTYDPTASYGQDGRWRWVLKDTDFGFGNEGGPQSYLHNTLEHASSTGGDPTTNPEWSTFVFRKLIENTTFRNHFINRFADILNSAYLPDRLDAIIVEMKAGIADEILKHGERWNSIQALGWEENINTMIQFAHQRPQYQRDHIREKFNINENILFTLNVNTPNAGYIKINTIDLNDTTPGVLEMPYPWSGIYFKDIPVKLKAVAQEGYVFSHWSGDVSSTETEITVTASQALSITANFGALSNGRIPIYFWALDANLPNLSLLTNVNATYGLPTGATLHYTSCLAGYPFPIGDVNWGKAAMTKAIAPTPINYIPEANYGISYLDAGIAGIMITQPFLSGDQENTMAFDLPTNGYENIVVSFAAKTMNAADTLLLDYAVNPGSSNWTTTGLPITMVPLNPFFTLYTTDLTAIAAVNDNPNFKFRLRFAGEDMEAINGGFVNFNNVSLMGSPKFLRVAKNSLSEFEVFPNPFTETVTVNHYFSQAFYTLHTVDGKTVAQGKLESEIELSDLPQGIYVLHLSADNTFETKKLIKK